MGNNNLFRIILSLAIIVGFFLPWFDYLGFVSGWDIVIANTGPGTLAERILGYSFLLIPLFALFVLIRSLGKQSSGFLLRFLPFLVTALLSVLFVIGEKNDKGTAGLNSFLSVLGAGYYITVIASLLLVFAGGSRGNRN